VVSTARSEPEVAHVLDRIEHLGDVREPHRCAVAVGDHQVAVLLGPGRLVVGVDLVALGADVHRTFRCVGIGGRERGAHVLEPDAILEERRGIQLDAHRRE